MAAVLGDAIGDPLPSALAVALSPILIVVVFGAAYASTAGPAFASGRIAGLAAVSVTVVVVLGSAPTPQETGVNWLKVVIGVLFWIMAAEQWQKRPEPDEDPAMPSWMAGIDSAAR